MSSRRTNLSVDRWRKLADQAAARAKSMKDAQARRAMHVIAVMYDQMAVRAQDSRADRSNNPDPQRDLNPT